MTILQFINPFAVRKFRLRSPLSPAECSDRLSARTLPWFQLRGLFGPDALPATGWVKSNAFGIRRRAPFPRNSYQPMAFGTWREVDGSTEIDVSVREEPTVAWLSLIWLSVAAVVAAMFLSSAATGRFDSNLLPVSVPAMLLLPLAGLSAQVYARWLARNEVELVQTFLMETLNADSLETALSTPSRADGVMLPAPSETVTSPSALRGVLS